MPRRAEEGPPRRTCTKVCQLKAPLLSSLTLEIRELTLNSSPLALLQIFGARRPAREKNSKKEEESRRKRQREGSTMSLAFDEYGRPFIVIKVSLPGPLARPRPKSRASIDDLRVKRLDMCVSCDLRAKISGVVRPPTAASVFLALAPALSSTAKGGKNSVLTSICPLPPTSLSSLTPKNRMPSPRSA